MHLTDWRAGRKTFRHRGYEIFFREEGEGDPLLLIHGFPTASWDWHRVWPALTGRYRVIAADMIGFGFSDKPRGYPYSLFDQADLHEGLLAALEINRLDILAHDYGDTVAQELLARQNKGTGSLEIRSICFLNGGIIPGEHTPRLIQTLLMKPLIGPLIGLLLDERRFGRSFAAVFGPQTQPTPAEIADFWTLIAHQDGQRIAHRIIRYMKEREINRDRWVRALQEARIPIRLVCGPADPVSGRHVAEVYGRLVPEADVIYLDEHVGHYPQFEDPAGTLAAYFDFRQAN